MNVTQVEKKKKNTAVKRLHVLLVNVCRHLVDNTRNNCCLVIKLQYLNSTEVKNKNSKFPFFVQAAPFDKV